MNLRLSTISVWIVWYNQPALSLFEFINPKVIKGIFKLQIFQSFAKHIRKYFKDPRLLALMEFPVLFLGAMPKETPALYSLMNYAGLKLGTWYPMGGFGKVIESMEKVAAEQGVQFYTSEIVNGFGISENRISHVLSSGYVKEVDGVVAAADYHHVEQELLPEKYRNYDKSYWDKRTMSPSCLIFYIGLNKKLENILHHNLFFHTSFEDHAIEIYKYQQWPVNPLFYVCCPSKTDPAVAPEGHENLFFLIPIAPGLKDENSVREEYYEKIIGQFEKLSGESIKENVIYKKSYCIKDFEKDLSFFQRKCLWFG